MPRTKQRNSRGFSLLEVVVALSILALSLMVLLQAQGQSLSSAGVSAQISRATLLARAKMIDLEQKLFEEGMVDGEVEDDGDFRHEGAEDIKWRSKVSPVQLDLTSLTEMCDTLAPKGKSTKAAASPAGGSKGASGSAQTPGEECANTLSSLSGMLQNFTGEISQGMRAVELTLSWPEGRYQRHLELRALVTKDDFSTLQQGAAQRAVDQSGLSGAAGGAAGQGAQPTGTTP